MTANEFLEQFADYTDNGLHLLRRTPVLDRFPADPSVYTAIAQEFFAGCDLDWEQRYRLVGILREFLYHDGRSFEALLWVAERAHSEPEYDTDGINALGAIYCYLNMDRPTPIADEELLARLAVWQLNESLRNNAGQCRRAILRRRPDLGASP